MTGLSVSASILAVGAVVTFYTSMVSIFRWFGYIINISHLTSISIHTFIYLKKKKKKKGIFVVVVVVCFCSFVCCCFLFFSILRRVILQLV